MATKNCPHCNKQVPVACKKCGCGHVFFAARRSANSTSRENVADTAVDSQELENPPGESAQSMSTRNQFNQGNHGGGSSQPTRRSGRVTRERPNFYDALEYENQTKRQKQLLRQQSKVKSEEQEGSDEAPPKTATASFTKDGRDQSQGSSSRRSKPINNKKRRGRPPGITTGRPPGITTGRSPGITTGGRKPPHQGYKIHNNNAASTTKKSSNGDGNADEAAGKSPEEYEDIMAGISAEKALQFNIVLQDINRKILRASWNKTTL